jgi:hypothetical protein
LAETIVPEAGTPAAPQGLPARLLGVLLAPRSTYAELAGRPRALGALAVILLVTVASTAIFLSTVVGREALLDEGVRQVESFGMTVTDAQYERLQAKLALASYATLAGQLVGLPVFALAVAGICFVVFAALGGKATFKQVFTIVVHSGVVVAVRSMIVLPLDYTRESLSNPTGLSVFLPFLDEGTFPARLLGVIDLFLLWWIVNLAIGLGVLYRRRTGHIAASLLIVSAAIALAIAAVKTALSGA